MERVRAAVDGPVLGAKLVDGELWVVGGDQPNRYNMDLIAAVFDVGGADVYTYSTPPRGRIRSSSISPATIFTSRRGTLPARQRRSSASSIIHDRAGNDRYVSQHQGSIAAGLFGVAILIDEAGNDQYINDTPGAGWSQGIGGLRGRSAHRPGG